MRPVVMLIVGILLIYIAATGRAEDVLNAILYGKNAELSGQAVGSAVAAGWQ